MNILKRLINGPGPDPRALAQGLTATRTGWGRYVYSGLPGHMREWTRRVPDDLDRLVCEHAGMPLPDHAPITPPATDPVECPADHSALLDCGTVERREVA